MLRNALRAFLFRFCGSMLRITQCGKDHISSEDKKLNVAETEYCATKGSFFDTAIYKNNILLLRKGES